MNKKVYVTRRLPEKVMQLMDKKFEYDVSPEERLATREELINGVKNYGAIVTMLNDNIDSEIISMAGPDLKLIANYGVGFNNIDVKAANSRGIYVSNTPGVLTDATADIAFTLLFSAARRVIEGDNIVRTSTFAWAPKYMLGYDITGKTVGIIGPGRIGSNFGKKAALGFNMKVLYYGRHNSSELDSIGAERVAELQDLLKRSDFVTIHVPLTPETRHLIGAGELAMMKATAILINTSRGPVVDEKALAEALSKKVIAAAGLDVYENEPDVEPALKTLKNVVLMPHLGTSTFETRENMGFLVVKNIEDVFAGNEPQNMVRVK
ncbi:MAG: D-glycerate dehydrogenase [Synergistaceae bacterium]|nr:D-glycerate dehydrogenase [Synergistaceae bacterium]MBQ9595199.1 D-glycerate dehydrogenase [Synergistaceae bacterium]